MISLLPRTDYEQEEEEATGRLLKIQQLQEVFSMTTADMPCTSSSGHNKTLLPLVISICLEES